MYAAINVEKLQIFAYLLMQVALLRQGKASGRLVVLVQALTTPTLVAAAAIDSQPAGSFVQGSNVPAVLQVCLHIVFDQSLLLGLWVADAGSA